MTYRPNGVQIIVYADVNVGKAEALNLLFVLHFVQNPSRQHHPAVWNHWQQDPSLSCDGIVSHATVSVWNVIYWTMICACIIWVSADPNGIVGGNWQCSISTSKVKPRSKATFIMRLRFRSHTTSSSARAPEIGNVLVLKMFCWMSTMHG